MLCLVDPGLSPEDLREARPCVFLDRDGVLIRDLGYLGDPEGIRFLENAPEGLRRMRRAGFRLVLVSNQSGVGRGYFTEADLLAVHRRMLAELARQGLSLDACCYCPHHPDDGCDCRKPRTGMLRKACESLAVDLAASWMVGDSECDMRLARNFSIPGILLSDRADPPDLGQRLTCRDLLQAAALIAPPPAGPEAEG